MEVVTRQPTAKGPPEWFTGDVWIDPLASAHEPTPLGALVQSPFFRRDLRAAARRSKSP